MSMWKLAKLPVFVLFSLVLLGEVAGFSQLNTGTISGILTDPSGSVVPGASVSTRNVETGLARTAQANDRGRFTVPELPVGQYEITIEAHGFQTQLRRGITLAVGQEAVINITLTVGAVSEKVEVTAEAPLVETTTATTSSLVTERTVRELPLNGRSFTDLMGIQPNVKNLVQIKGTSPNVGYGANFSVSGAHPHQTNYIVDGVVINDARTASPASVSGNLLGTDTIREFRMLAGNFSAEYGMVSGGIMTAVTKSGTNSLHGSAFEFLRNSALDARRFFDRNLNRPTVRSSPPPFKRNQFGFTLGGPLRTDHTFFFGSYEGLRERLATTTIQVVPNLNARRGVLPRPSCANGCAVGPTAQRVLDLFPLPNTNDHGDGTADYISARSNPTNEDYFSIRLDHNLTPNNYLFGSYTSSEGSISNPDASGLFMARSTSLYKHPVIGLTSILNQGLLLSLRAGVNRAPVSNSTTATEGVDVSPLLHTPANLGLGVGSVSISGCCSLGGESHTRYNFTSYQYAGDITYTRGSHSFKFGFDLLRNQSNQDRAVAQVAGTYSFASLENYYLERPASTFSTGPNHDQNRGWRQWLRAAYLTDDWHALPNLTWNLGVRFEWSSVPTEVNGKVATVHRISDMNTVVGDPFWQQASAFWHALPRVGFAWDPFRNGKTSVRGGVGIFEEPIRNAEYTTSGDNNCPFYCATLASDAPGLPVIYPDAYANFNRPGAGVTRLDVIAFQIHQPYRMNWSLDVQREVLPGLLTTVGYAGGRGVHELGFWSDVNQPPSIIGSTGRRYIPLGTQRLNPNFTQNIFRDTNNDSYYNSFQLGVQKRFNGGLQVSSSYSWSKSIDTNSNRVFAGPEFGGSVGEAFPFDTRANRGPSAWDLRQYWSTNYVYELPIGPGRAIAGNWHGVIGKVIEGWSLSGVIQLNSGAPFSNVLGFDYAASLPQSGGGGQKPDLVYGAKLNAVNDGYRKDPDHYYDVSGFVLPPLTPECAATNCTRRVFGNIGRNTIYGPGLATYNFNLLKTTQLTERTQLQFRSELFNILNRANFALPNGTVFNANNLRNSQAGRITDVRTTARQIQFALKLIF